MENTSRFSSSYGSLSSEVELDIKAHIPQQKYRSISLMWKIVLSFLLNVSQVHKAFPYLHLMRRTERSKTFGINCLTCE